MPDDNSDEWSRLARIASELATGVEASRKDDIWRALDAPVRKLAVAIARRLSSKKSDSEFVAQDAVVHVYEKLVAGKWDSQQGAFRPWLNTVIGNYIRSGNRKKTREKSNVEPTEAEEFRDEILELTRLQEGDYIEIAAWKRRERLVLLSLSGVWRRVDQQRWCQWCEEMDVDIDWPPNFATATDKIELFKKVSSWLRMSRNFVSQEWHRKSHLLKSLPTLGSEYGYA